MQVPGKLALIGGSILLSSTLTFTLKSQASSLIPNVSHSISHVFDHIGDAKQSSDFNTNLERAEHNGWQTGQWGTAPYYVDDQHNMHVGHGDLQSDAQGVTLRTLLGDTSVNALRTLSIDQPVRAPQDSSNLFSTSNGDDAYPSNLQQINGLANVDTSQVTSMYNMFTNDDKLQSIHGINEWNVQNVSSMQCMFYDSSSLRSLDISGWNDSKLPDQRFTYRHNGLYKMFGSTGIKQLSLGPIR